MPFALDNDAEEVLLAACSDVSILVPLSAGAGRCAVPPVSPGGATARGTPLREVVDATALVESGLPIAGATIRDPAGIAPARRAALRVHGFYVRTDGTPTARAAVRATMFANFPGVFVLAREDLVQYGSPVQRYIVADMNAAAALALVAVMIAFVDAAFRRRREYAMLVALGGSRRFLASLVVLESAAPIALAVPLTVLIGTVTAAAFLSIVGAGSGDLGSAASILVAGVVFAAISALVAAAVVVPAVAEFEGTRE